MTRILTVASVVWRDVIRRKDVYVLLILLGVLLVALVSMNLFGQCVKLFTTNLCAKPFGESIDHPEPDIMSRLVVFTVCVSKSDDQFHRSTLFHFQRANAYQASNCIFPSVCHGLSFHERIR